METVEIVKEVSPYAIPGILRQHKLIDIKQVVCGETGIEVEDLELVTRKKEIVRSRQLAQALTRWILKWGYHKIGLEIGKKDHATVLHAIRTVRNDYQTDKNYREMVGRILCLLGKNELKEKFME